MPQLHMSLLPYLPSLLATTVSIWRRWDADQAMQVSSCEVVLLNTCTQDDVATKSLYSCGWYIYYREKQLRREFPFESSKLTLAQVPHKCPYHTSTWRAVPTHTSAQEEVASLNRNFP